MIFSELAMRVRDNALPLRAGAMVVFVCALLLAAALPARAGLLQDNAECRHNYAIWGMGSFRAIAHSACRLDLTAWRVVDFHARLVTGG